MLPVCPRRTACSFPFNGSQILPIPSPPTEAMREPSGDQATFTCRLPSRLCPENVNTGFASIVSQTTAVQSSSPATRYLPSGLHEIEMIPPLCPRRQSGSGLLLASQILTVASSPPDARNLPSGLQATELTFASCPRRVSSASFGLIAS